MKLVLLSMPIFLLIITRLGVELSVRLFPVNLAWVPSALIYYLTIELCLYYAKKKLNVTVNFGFRSLRHMPKPKYFWGGFILPALIPFGFFLMNVRAVPKIFFIYIILFAATNPYFEEAFWRGLLDNIPASRGFRVMYTSSLFAFSHYLVWGSYWLSEPRKWIPVVIATFIMGMLWMWFYQKEKNLIYPIVSHCLVDIFNLSAAVFCLLRLHTI